jgi:hypothetical protein
VLEALTFFSALAFFELLALLLELLDPCLFRAGGFFLAGLALFLFVDSAIG